MHARSDNPHDGARSAPEICAIFMNRRANSSYFHEADLLALNLRCVCQSRTIYSYSTGLIYGPRCDIPVTVNSSLNGGPSVVVIVPVSYHHNQGHHPLNPRLLTPNTTHKLLRCVKPSLSTWCAPIRSHRHRIAAPVLRGRKLSGFARYSCFNI